MSAAAMVYRMYDAAGSPLYYGYTTSKGSRFAQHSYTQGWWVDVATIQLEHFETISEARDSERMAILEDRPKFNRIREPKAVAS